MLQPIVTTRLRMRPFESDDAWAGFALWAEPEVGRFTGGAHATIAESRALIEKNRAHGERHGFALWAVEERETGALVGEAGLQLLEGSGPEVEIGWAFAPSAWGRGYATEAANAFLDVAFGGLGLDRVIAVIREENAASHRVAERLGMRPAGRRRVYGADHDVYEITPADRAAAG